MEYVRHTMSVCPVCCKPLDAKIRVQDGGAYLCRTCPEHGDYNFLLSVHGEQYADLDRFYNSVLDSTRPRGRLTNYWIIATLECQMQCSYCSVETGGGRCREMTWDELKEIIHTHKDTKLTIMGGEPTLYKHVLDFFREARAASVLTQLSTNGVKLAEMEFCKALKEAGMTEVRMALESTDAEKASKIGTDPFIPAKLQALKNLEALDIVTVTSPTIFKGVNEDEVAKMVDYAKDKPFVHSISVNGFSWIGRGAELSRDMMIMPDEMMDTLYKHYFTSDRDDIFTFQKALYALLDVVRIRLCLYTQIMIFVRHPDKVVPITEYIAMNRLKRGMKWWERFAKKGTIIKGLTLGAAFATSLKLRTLRLFPALITLFMANVLGITVTNYPRRLLPVILNTNCSPLSYDEMVGQQCMSGLIYAEADQIICGDSSSSIITKERRRYADQTKGTA